MKNKSVLITGGTGSFGKVMVSHLLKLKIPQEELLFLVETN